MKIDLRLTALILSVLALSGCSSEEPPTTSTQAEAPVVGDWEDEDKPEDVEEDEEDEPVVLLDPIDLRLVIKAGQEQKYRLTNEISTTVQSPTNSEDKETYSSHLNARQSVEVGEDESVFIQTTDVDGAVIGEGMMTAMANVYMQSTVKAIEGSMMVAAYDETGSGKNVMMIGEGMGLNPLGAQADPRDATVGFMGVILPGGTVKPGDSWAGEYDAAVMAGEVFKDMGAQTSNGTIPLTYFLRGYDLERGLAQISITGSGIPIIDLPIENSIVKIEMQIYIEGEALVRLSDGWLYELRIETDVITEGLYATKQKVRTLIQIEK